MILTGPNPRESSLRDLSHEKALANLANPRGGPLKARFQVGQIDCDGNLEPGTDFAAFLGPTCNRCAMSVLCL